MIGRLLRRLRYFFSRGRRERELAEEMSFHRSLSSGPAFGNATLAREDARGVWIWPWLESAWQDLRYAVRSLRRDKAFTLVAVGALGAAIGLNSSLFVTFNGVMLRPWPVPDPDRVVTLVTRNGLTAFSLAEYAYLSTSARSVEGLVVSRCLDGVSSGCLVQMDDTPLTADLVSRNYFDVLRTGMARGAGFSGAKAQGETVVVVSYAAWRTRFSADPAIVGRVIRLDDVPFTIVGVTEPGFTGTDVERRDLWVPLDAVAALRPHYVSDDRKRFGFVAGRLAAGSSRAQAETELDTLSRQFHAAQRTDDRGVRLTDSTFFAGQGRRSNANSVFGLMLLAVLLVLGLACANVGNLLLARASGRRREVATRLAIGASRARVVRQLLTECFVLSMVATAIGLAIARWLPGLILTRLAGPLSVPVEPDSRVLAYTIGIAIVSCFAFGLAPASHATGGRLAVASFAAGSRPHARSGRVSTRSILLAAQVAIAMILLVSAGLLVRGVRAVAEADPGFDMHGVSVVSLDLPASYETARVRAFAGQILQGAGATVVGRSYGFADVVPFGAGGRLWMNVADTKNQQDDVLAVDASRGYFETLGIPIVQGRNLEPGDRTANAVLVNESFARRFWPNEISLGQVVRSGGHEYHVVGIVRDVRHYAFAVRGAYPTIYMPIGDRTIPQILVRGMDPASPRALDAFARALEPRARLTVTPLERNLDARLTRPRAAAWLASGVGVLGLILATLGVFSVFAYTIEQRTAEIGIRMALGARPAHVLRMVLGANGLALAAGLGCGLVASFASARVIRSFLFGLSPFDPLAYGTVIGIICVAGIIATVYPARKAMRIDPVVALRCE